MAPEILTVTGISAVISSFMRFAVETISHGWKMAELSSKIKRRNGIYILIIIIPMGEEDIKNMINIYLSNRYSRGIDRRISLWNT